MVPDLKQFLSHFPNMRRNGDEKPRTETDQDITIAEPSVRDDVSVVLLKGELNGIVGVE